MRTEERAQTLAALEKCRQGLAATSMVLKTASETISVWRQRPATREEIEGLRTGLQTGIAALDSFSAVADEVERLVVLAPTETPFDDGGAKAVTTDDATAIVSSAETLLVGVHSALRDVTTLLAAQEHGQKFSREVIHQHRQGVTDIAVLVDTSIQQLKALRGRQS